MKKLMVLSLLVVLLAACQENRSVEGNPDDVIYLTGQSKDDVVEWDFMVSDGRQAGQWSKIKVPSHWELEGFGSYNYGRDDDKSNESGTYKRQFKVPQEWESKRTFIVFEASMTDTEVKLNGQSVGATHQGAFYEFQYELTPWLKYGEASNTLEVKVNKSSANASLDSAERYADYWVFGGIFRPVYLKSVAQEHISRVAIDANAQGQLKADVFLEGIEACDEVKVSLTTLTGENIGSPIRAELASGSSQVQLMAQFDEVELWTAETPNLYYANFELIKQGETIDTHRERIGFRTVRIAEEGHLEVNGQRVFLKGVNRHSFRPHLGRAISPAHDLEDVLLLKEMNMNAVRCAHYPPNKSFLDYCDEKGLYVLNELCAWTTPLETEIGKKLIKELVVRDVNHPSIIFWDNGNHNAFNPALEKEFGKWDIQQRRVLRMEARKAPLPLPANPDWRPIDTRFYPSTAMLKERLNGSNPVMPCEFSHALYDGGGGAGLDTAWAMIRRSPVGVGSFIWALVDEGVVRSDLNGVIDVKGNQAPDGILGP
ncbi:MAG: glycoside hydrolase family 2 TIM barrel-domain containing protein, partial [Reichenbachiella sp.]